MKKSLKLVAIFMAVIIVGVVGGVSIYLLIANNKTYYIYDVRIVEPVSSESYYVYTDSEAEYSSMRNQIKYLKCDEENSFEIGVYAYTSTNTTKVNVTSSNENVATVKPINGHMIVNYFGAGETEITAEVGGVTDTITLIVYDIPAEDFLVFDDSYYGENYSKYYGNEISVYADAKEYHYKFKISDKFGGEFSDNVNSQYLKIDYSTVNKDAFPETTNVRIDPINNEFILKCEMKNDLPEVNVITVNSCSYSKDGSERVVYSFPVVVKIITYVPQYLQIMLSKTPDFDEGAVFMDTIVVDASKFTEEQILEDRDILNDFLNYQKAELSLSENENSVYAVYFNKHISKIYMKMRKVYTNGDVTYLNPLTQSTHGHEILFNGESEDEHVRLSADQTYYILSLDSAYFDSNDDFSISVSLNDYDLSHVFKILHSSLDATDESEIEKFYTFNAESQTYTFTYWDERSRFENEIYDKNGNIVGFGV